MSQELPKGRSEDRAAERASRERAVTDELGGLLLFSGQPGRCTWLVVHQWCSTSFTGSGGNQSFERITAFAEELWDNGRALSH